MNLIICTTPLQTLLAKEIVKNYEDEEFYGILFSNHFSKKVDRYFNLFGVLCHILNKIYYKSSIKLVCLILYYKIKLFNKKFDKIFVANIENILIQSIISSLKFNELITFDDGTANILENSTKETPLATELPVKKEKKQIQKIIFFYEDNSFEIFENL